MIEVEGLTKQYGSVRAVDDLTFSVQPGAVTGFLGPNGAGKSTTMRMILGLDKPTAGTARINGQHYSEFKEPLREVGALLDAKAVHPNRSARNHLKWLAHANGIPASRVDEVLELVGLSDVAHKKAGGYSLGMGQRLGLAAALLGDPGVLILDEPVNGLDPPPAPRASTVSTTRSLKSPSARSARCSTRRRCTPTGRRAITSSGSRTRTASPPHAWTRS